MENDAAATLGRRKATQRPSEGSPLQSQNKKIIAKMFVTLILILKNVVERLTD